jgi:hypothetical protein
MKLRQRVISRRSASLSSSRFPWLARCFSVKRLAITTGAELCNLVVCVSCWASKLSFIGFFLGFGSILRFSLRWQATAHLATYAAANRFGC